MTWKISFVTLAEHNVVEAHFLDVVLNDDADVARWHEEVERHLSRYGTKVDLLINLDGLVVRPKASKAFGRLRTAVLQQYARRSFRYGGDAWTRTSIATTNVLQRADANLFRTREEALAALLENRSRSES